MKISKDILVKDTDRNIFQIKHKDGERDIYFLLNSNSSMTIRLESVFPAGGKTPWIWDPEDGTGIWLTLDKINKGVTEVYLNGRFAGINWYGRPRFRIDSLLLKGENRLEIKYISILSNYVRSLKENPTAARWTGGYEKMPSGLEGSADITR